MREWYKINAKHDSTDIMIYDIIGEDFWGEGVSAKGLIDEIGNLKTDLNIYINSPGGDIHEGKAIINALNRYKKDNKAKINTIVDGDALSMASGIFMVGDTRTVHENSTFMIHDPWTIAGGNSTDFRAVADLLDMESQNLLIAYRESGLGDDDIRNMMAAETWLRGEDIVNAGFATEVIEPLKMAATYDKRILSKFHNVPKWFNTDVDVIDNIVPTVWIENGSNFTISTSNGESRMYAGDGTVTATPGTIDGFTISDNGVKSHRFHIEQRQRELELFKLTL